MIDSQLDNIGSIEALNLKGKAAIANTQIIYQHYQNLFSSDRWNKICLLYTSPSPRDRTRSRMPSSACKKKTITNSDNIILHTITYPNTNIY